MNEIKNLEPQIVWKNFPVSYTHLTLPTRDQV